MKLYPWCCLLFLTAACSNPKLDTRCQQVTIVAVTHSEETGAPDWYTIVQFPDSTRRYRNNRWGVVGDQFCARKQGSTGWL